MKVEVKNSPTVISFDDLETGDVFMFHNDYYMVTSHERISDYNAICLTDGELTCFSPSDKVYLKDAILTIS